MLLARTNARDKRINEPITIQIMLQLSPVGGVTNLRYKTNLTQH
jgi:hypothetical protein